MRTLSDDEDVLPQPPALEPVKEKTRKRASSSLGSENKRPVRKTRKPKEKVNALSMESVHWLMDESEDEEQEEKDVGLVTRPRVPVHKSSEPKAINKGTSAEVPEPEVTPSPTKTGELESQRKIPQASEEVPRVEPGVVERSPVLAIYRSRGRYHPRGRLGLHQARSW